MISRSISEFSPTRLPHLSTAIFLRRFLFRAPLPLCALRVLCGESSFFSGFSSPNCQISAKNAKSANITLRLSIILSNNVGAPTLLISARPLFSANLCVLCASALSFSFSVPDFQLSTLNFQPSLPRKSNYSRTSETFSRKSNHSRTYAKTGGGGTSSQKCPCL